MTGFGRLLRGALAGAAVSLVALAQATAEDSPPIAWIAVGGGADPASTQLSLEEDVQIAAQTFAGEGITLFAGGPDAMSVQFQVEKDPKDLSAALGEILDPRDGRGARYRRPQLPGSLAATPENFDRAMSSAVLTGETPLVILIATHGERGDTPRQNRIVLWGEYSIDAAGLAESLDAAKPARTVIVVNAACYGGGFAEFAFTDAYPQSGPPTSLRCGLFASTEDEVASGCDPNPTRRDDEGYARYVLRALTGRDHRGGALRNEQIDFDGNGKVSLLEAHTRARIATRSFDIPTSTSERWLREFAPKEGTSAHASLPEERAVIAALGRTLNVDDAPSARSHLDSVQAGFEEEEEAAREIEDELNDAAADLRIAILSRWPLLDDPWHPEFAKEFRRNRGKITRFLAKDPKATEYRRLRDAFYAQAAVADERHVDLAVARRLVRAYETVDLAERLKAAGGKAWEHYEKLLACERTEPAIRH